MGNYSLFSIVREGLRGNTGWTPAWRDPDPKPSYDAVIIGGGGHGLATAYYLAKIHGMTNIAVVEKGWIGGGNSGRNTTIIRSNYLYDASAAIYEHALKLWEGLSHELNYNIMMSHRGVLNLAHDDNEARQLKRRVEANRLNGVDAEYLDAKQIKEFCPILNTSPDIRYPVIGATLQRRGGTNRHDAVCWGYARAADALGVDIIQNCEVTEILTERGQVTGIRTSRGDIKTPKVASVTAGHTSVIADMVGVRLPIESHPLQALVSEPLKPVNPCVVMSNAVHVYCSQSDKGELVIGAGIDAHTSYTQRGSLDIIEHQMAAIVELFPIFSQPADDAPMGRHRRRLPGRQPDHFQDRGRRLLRQWRLGHRRLEGDPRLRPRLCRPRRQRHPQCHRRALHRGALRHRRPGRRTRRRRRRPLTPVVRHPPCSS